MAVITISRQFGSGGDEIVDRVCELTGYRRFDKQLIAQAAKEASLSEQEIIDFSEEDYKAKTFIDRLLGRSKPAASVRVWKEHMDGSRYTEEMPVDEEHALSMVQKAILAAYHHGDWIIVGRGGQMLLKDFPDVLNLRIEAPMEDRIQRVKKQFDLERRPAQDMITAKDIVSADYLKRFYGVDWSDPYLYQMVLNTANLDLNIAAHFINAMVGCLKGIAV